MQKGSTTRVKDKENFTPNLRNTPSFAKHQSIGNATKIPLNLNIKGSASKLQGRGTSGKKNEEEQQLTFRGKGPESLKKERTTLISKKSPIKPLTINGSDVPRIRVKPKMIKQKEVKQPP